MVLAENKANHLLSVNHTTKAVHHDSSKVDLPEVDFSFHEGNYKVKEMTEVLSCDHEASFVSPFLSPQ